MESVRNKRNSTKNIKNSRQKIRNMDHHIFLKKVTTPVEEYLNDRRQKQ